jgi:2'-5' RNA ligase
VTHSSQHPFPPEPPASLADRAEIIRNDWTAFSRLDTLTNHWQRPAWPDGAQAFYWLLPLGGVPGLRAQALAFMEALASVPDLDPVPSELLHLTISRVGAATAIADEQLTAIATAAADRLKSVEPIHLHIGPLAGSTGAIRFSVTPWSGLMKLRDELVAATRSVLDCPSNAGWRPHVSIAYNTRPRAASLVVDRVRELRAQPPIEITATDVELVKLVRTGRVYQWTTIHRLTLLGQQAATD